jgi:tRNA threonylcarbamoyl adenosine modification protein YeaZ
MRVLGIETSGRSCGCAVVEDDRLLGQKVSDLPGEHVEKLVQLIGNLLEETSLEMESLEGVAVSLGPGSFTGLRIGLATAKGICFGTGLPLAGVPSLDAMAETVSPWDGNIVTTRDARRGEIYVATYRSAGCSVARTSDYFALKPEEVAGVIAGIAEQGRTIVSGDALERYGGLLRRALPAEVLFAPGELWTPSPPSVAAIGVRMFEEGKTLDMGNSEPLYLRPSEAERQAMSGGGSIGRGAPSD